MEKEKKPAKSAEAYLMAEDRRIYEKLVKVAQVLKEELCPEGIPRALGYPLTHLAAKEYDKAKKEAALYWGSYEISDVYSKLRETGLGYVGRFGGLPEEL